MGGTARAVPFFYPEKVRMSRRLGVWSPGLLLACAWSTKGIPSLGGGRPPGIRTRFLSTRQNFQNYCLYSLYQSDLTCYSSH